jgi:hypothetical protein
LWVTRLCIVNGIVVYRYQLAAFFIAPYFTTFSHAKQKKTKTQKKATTRNMMEEKRSILLFIATTFFYAVG